MIGEEKSATERLAQRILDEKQHEAYERFLEPINEQIREERDRRQAHLDELGTMAKEKREAEEERQKAFEEYQRKQEEEKPTRTREAYRRFLHGLKGEDD